MILRWFKHREKSYETTIITQNYTTAALSSSLVCFLVLFFPLFFSFLIIFLLELTLYDVVIQDI